MYVKSGRLLSGLANGLLLVGLPVFLWQGWRLRKTMPRLPEAAGERTGELSGDKPPLHLLVLGESTAVGVGAEYQGQALAGQLALQLQQCYQRSVNWQAAGRSGADAAEVLHSVWPDVKPGRRDIVVIVLGVNDVLGWTSPRRWQQQLQTLIGQVSEALQQPYIIITGVPPLWLFPSMPLPLNSVFYLRCKALDQAAKKLLSDRNNVLYAELVVAAHDELFASDGFHPSAQGYARWAQHLAEQLDNFMLPS